MLDALCRANHEAVIESFTDKNCAVADADEPLNDALQRLHASDRTSLPVIQKGALVGLLTLEHMANWLALQRAITGPGHVLPARSRFGSARVLRGFEDHSIRTSGAVAHRR